MNEYSFTVTKTGYINVEADSVEDAEARLQENFGHLYVITETGEELSNGWETTGEVELEEECAFNDYEEDYDEIIVYKRATTGSKKRIRKIQTCGYDL